METERTAVNEPIIAPTRAVALLGVQGCVLTAAGVGLWLLSGRSLATFVTVSIREIAIGIAFAAVLIALAATVFRGLPRIGEQLVRLQSDTYRFLGPNLGWSAIVTISLVAGISEETLLRAGLQTYLTDLMGPIGAIAVASGLFAAMHLAKPLITVLLFAIGVLFGVVYWYTGSALAVMIAHVLYDVWALRYLNREMHRLNLFDEPGPLAKEAAPG